MWQDIVVRELAVFVNISIEAAGLNFLLNTKPILRTIDPLLTSLQFKKEDQTSVDLISRIMNVLSKLSKETKGANEIALSKNLILRVILYFNKAIFPIELLMSSLRILHNCCKSTADFRATCLETHGFTLKTFDTIVSDSRSLVTESIAKQDWETLINTCSLISALADILPER